MSLQDFFNTPGQPSLQEIQNKAISELQSKFVGSKLKLITTEKEYQVAGKTTQYVVYELDESDPLLLEIRDHLKHYPAVRIELPGKMYTAEYNQFRMRMRVLRDGTIDSFMFG